MSFSGKPFDLSSRAGRILFLFTLRQMPCTRRISYPSSIRRGTRRWAIPDDRANFYGMIANFDENLGNLFLRLKELRIDENTIVIFTADHGTAAGYDPESGEGFNAGMRGKKGRSLRWRASCQFLHALEGQASRWQGHRFADRAR